MRDCMKTITIQMPKEMPKDEYKRNQILVDLQQNYVRDSFSRKYNNIARIPIIILDTIALAALSFGVNVIAPGIITALSLAFLSVYEANRLLDNFSSKTAPYHIRFIDHNWRPLMEWRQCSWALTQIDREFEMERGGSIEIRALPPENCSTDIKDKFREDAIKAGLRISWIGLTTRLMGRLTVNYRKTNTLGC
jgi:hypothetical protein